MSSLAPLATAASLLFPLASIVSNMTTLAPVIALSHGGGPMPLLGDKNHDSIVYSLKNRVPKLLGLGTPSQPRAIVLVTAHWSTSKPTISSGQLHDLYYDYYGFPPESYNLKYPASGDPAIAADIKQALEDEGLQGLLDDKRGWDHGVFVPLLLVNPKADVPIVQMSVLQSEDAETHLRMGRALARLRAANIAVVGSGFASLHNFDTFRGLRTADPRELAAIKAKSNEWNKALTEVVSAPKQEARWKGLREWRRLPHANAMHPIGGGEHFMPLVVCAGAAGDETAHNYKDDYSGVEIFTYYWGAEPVE